MFQCIVSVENQTHCTTTTKAPKTVSLPFIDSFQLHSESSFVFFSRLHLDNHESTEGTSQEVHSTANRSAGSWLDFQAVGTKLNKFYHEKCRVSCLSLLSDSLGSRRQTRELLPTEHSHHQVHGRSVASERTDGEPQLKLHRIY